MSEGPLSCSHRSPCVGPRTLARVACRSLDPSPVACTRAAIATERRSRQASVRTGPTRDCRRPRPARTACQGPRPWTPRRRQSDQEDVPLSVGCLAAASTHRACMLSASGRPLKGALRAPLRGYALDRPRTVTTMTPGRRTRPDRRAGGYIVPRHSRRRHGEHPLAARRLLGKVDTHRPVQRPCTPKHRLASAPSLATWLAIG